MTAFRNHSQLASLSPFKYISSQKCEIAQRQRDLDCALGVAYFIPLACGSCYIVRAARCVNERPMEPKRNVKNKVQNSEQATHVAACARCRPICGETVILESERGDIS